MTNLEESPVAWLASLATGQADGRSPSHVTSAVWSLATARGPALLATDRRVLAAVFHPEAAALALPLNASYAGAVKGWLDSTGQPLGTLDVAHLRQWCLPPTPAAAEPCAACQGTGEIACDECNGTGDVTCEYGHDHDCPDCGATGKVACDHDSGSPPALERPCKVGTLTLDRNVLLRLPAQLTGSALAEVIPQGSYGARCLRLSGEGWTALLMPLIAGRGDDPVYPLAAA